ncbi:unnamed protein product [Chironomus riparius]|uniref:Uncharacterized protein n=1 Tax=Chironomus riparius TaxID=315576 RepID=A0A9P0JAH7_9DIPT|nr:unnamed protein product [Chironomus riparius]
MARVALFSTSTGIGCTYYTNNWTIVKGLYYCFINNDPRITSRESAKITSITGNHKIWKSNVDVQGFHIDVRTINYFPRFEAFFVNVKLICIYNSNLKEVHQEDLKPYPRLIEIALHYNSIEVLEEGLFDFNPDLVYIDMSNNKIVHVEPKVFDHLSKLMTLHLDSNICISIGASNSRPAVTNLLLAIISGCSNAEFSSLKNQLDNLESEAKSLNSEEFRGKLTTYEKTLISSKFANFRPLNYKFDVLKNLKIEQLNQVKTSDLDAQLRTLNDLMTKMSIDVNDLKSSTNQCLADYNISISPFKSVQDQFDIKSSIEGISATLKLSKNELKMSVMEMENTQKSFGDKIENLEGQIVDLKADNAEKFAQIRKELSSTRHKIGTTIDEKIKGIEKRILRKFEDILEDKLRQIFEANVEKFIEG